MSAAAEQLELMAGLLADIDISTIDDADLGRSVLGAERLLNAARALSAELLGAFEQRGSWADDGARSGSRWVADRTGSATPAVRARTRVGVGLRLLPAASRVARDGWLSGRHLRDLAGCARAHAATAERDEAVLVEQALRLGAEAFAIVARQWTEHAEAVAAPDPACLPVSESVDDLHLSQTFDGRWRLDGSFSAETGGLLHAALDAEVDRALRAARDGDPSVPVVPSQVRAAALVDLVGQTMRREPSDAAMPDRYRVAVVVHPDRPDALAACDSPAYRAVLGAAGEVLDVGRLTPAWPAGIRRAITHRDGGCVFPGCDRPRSWWDIHHCQPWHQGGRTSADNGAMLCRRHHTFIHTSGWSVAVEHGKPTVRRPDGAQYVICRWQEAA